MLTYVFLFIIFIVIFCLMEYHYNKQFKKILEEDFPKDILLELDNSVQLPNINKNNKIPKKIYRTFYDLDEAEKNYKKAFEITKSKNPELEQIVYDDVMVENFIKNNYSERIYNAYKSINPKYGPARADFFRYLIIYYYGGIYLDVKSALVKNIDQELKENKLLTSKGRHPEFNFFPFGMTSQFFNKYNWSTFSGTKYGEFNNWHIIAPAGNEILGKTIQHIVTNIEYAKKHKNFYKQGEYSVLALTGPIIYSRVILKYANKDNIKFYENNLNGKVKYSAISNHKNITKRKHYSKITDKKILI